MTEDKTFAVRVLEAFAANGNYTDSKVEAAGGPSDSTMTKIRKAAKGEAGLDKPRSDTYDGIDAAAGWTPGSAHAFHTRGIEPRLSEPRISEADEDQLVRALARLRTTKRRDPHQGVGEESQE